MVPMLWWVLIIISKIKSLVSKFLLVKMLKSLIWMQNWMEIKLQLLRHSQKGQDHLKQRLFTRWINKKLETLFRTKFLRKILRFSKLTLLCKIDQAQPVVLTWQFKKQVSLKMLRTYTRVNVIMCKDWERLMSISLIQKFLRKLNNSSKLPEIIQTKLKS